MAIATLAAYQARVARAYTRVAFQKNTITTISGLTFSSWLAAGFPAAGATPGASAVPTNATTGAMPTTNDSPGLQRILKVVAGWATQTPGILTISDRLVHMGGLSGIVTTAQTVSTSALTRYTSGVGVEAAFEVYTQIGATGTTITASYTNTVPTAGQTSPANTFGGTNYRSASRFIQMPLAAGDVGVTAVSTCTVLATTGTAGSFGVTLHYPLITIPMNDEDPLGVDEEALFGLGSCFPQIVDSNCLFFLYHTNGTSTGVVSGVLQTAED